MKNYTGPVYPYVRSSDQEGPTRHHPVIVVGAGPVGLTAAIDLAQRGTKVLVLDEDDTVSVGSRAICYAKRALEIFDRLGCGEPVVRKGVRWNVGKVFHRDALVYQFDLLPEPGHRHPAFVNLQQYHLEECLVRRLEQLRAADVRWKTRVIGVVPHGNRVNVRVACPDGEYCVTCDWLIAADGARSPVRTMLHLDSEGQVFRDRFLIADIHMQSDFPTERWFWFDPPFHPGQSVLLHRQADDVWRIDFQLGWDADPEVEKRPERILLRLRAMLGPDADFEIVWASVYTFQCARMPHFRHGRVLFAGDAAHLLSPFGARGANSGVQDADNLGWKLDLVLKDRASARLLDSYDAERCAAADENLLHSTRATNFITPKSVVSRTFRDAVLGLAKRYPFAQKLVNSGRLSQPHVHVESPLNTPDRAGDSFDSVMVPGTPAIDAPVFGRGAFADVVVPGAHAVDASVSARQEEWLLGYLGDDFALLAFGDVVSPEEEMALAAEPVPCRVVRVGAPGGIADPTGLLTQRYDGKPGTCYLFRPDQIACARWRSFEAQAVRTALARAIAGGDA